MNIRSSQERDYSLDNIRFLLIFSVVFAHLLEVCTPFAESGHIYKFIYAFHMPAFIFLFGYNVKYLPKRIVYRWCIPYVIFQCAYIFFARAVLNTNASFQFTTPYWLLWYMLSCIFYQLLLPLFDLVDKRKQILAIGCVFVISLLIGYDNTVGYNMSLSRFFVFQPWFLLGYYCKKNDILEQLSAKPKRRVIILLVLTAIVVFLTPYLYEVPNGLLYGSYSYTKCGGTLAMRAFVYLMSFLMILILFVGIKPHLGRKLWLITSVGQNTWPIFLLHGFAVKAAAVYFPYLLSDPWRVMLLCCAIVILTGNKVCSDVIYYACFSWIEKLPAKPACKKKGRG